VLAAYRSIDKYNDGAITILNLGSFLRSTGHFAGELELYQIIRRIDASGDLLISLNEFSDFLSNP
jgi:Ca2+-binding EF-hand superfamily protein